MARSDRQDIVAQADASSPDVAEKLLKKHLKKRPRDAEALEALARLLSSQHRLSEIASSLVSVAMTPNAPASIIVHACEAATARKEFEAARRIAIHGTAIHSDEATVWAHRGKAELATSDAPSAVTSLERAHQLDPDAIWILSLLADADISRGAFPIPEKHARHLLELEPDVATHHVRLGTALRFNDHLDDAEECFRQAIALDPSLQAAHAGLAETLESAGKSEEAIAQLDSVINSSSPSFAVVSAWARIQLHLGNHGDAIPAMERYLASQRGGASHQTSILMRLGRAYELSGRYDDAFRCWTQGNAAHRGRWDPDGSHQFVDAMIETMTKDRITSLPAASPAPFTPILVVGMYRSGTTLTEQILSAHPQIAPAGESPAMPTAIRLLAEEIGPIENFPHSLADATQDAVNKASKAYVEQIHSQVKGDIIVDKLPMNYLNLGIASLLLPNAKVLHLVRDPLDTAISCYSQSFASRMAFTADLDHLGQAITQERRIMQHWDSAIPLPMLRVEYETLAKSPESTLRNIIEFLELPWDDAVLNFHTSKRVAATPSMDQVRKPINTSAIGRAAHFDAYLEPLKSSMEA